MEFKFGCFQEAAFQHLFNEALTMQLPLTLLLPRTEHLWNPTGKHMAEELDFFTWLFSQFGLGD
jgi:hypothetical protein